MEGFPEQAESMKKRLESAAGDVEKNAILYQYLSAGVMKQYGMGPDDIRNSDMANNVRGLLNRNPDSNID